MKKTGALLLGLTAMVLTLITTVTPAAAAQSPARVRVIYTAAEGPANVDVYVDGSRFWSGVPYKSVTAYFRVASGSHDIKIRAAGSGSGGSVLASVQQTTDAGAFYTTVVADKQSDLKIAVFTDGFPQQTAGKAVVRFIHTAPEVPGVDITPVNNCSTKVFTNIAFMQGSPYLAVDGGTYNLELHTSGQCDAALFTASGVPLPAGIVNTVVALGGEGKSVEAMLVPDAASALNAPNGGATTGEGGLAGDGFPTGLAALIALMIVAGSGVALRRGVLAGRTA